MSAFSAAWLSLREGADHRSLDGALLAALREAHAGRESVAVVDLGCGTGSNLRATSPHLPRRQSWRLVDHDPALLAAAQRDLIAWADRAVPSGAGLRLVKERRELAVTFVEADLAAGLEEAIGAAPDIVTAAALFDLVSQEWIARFAAAVAARRAVFHATLVYDGRSVWAPPHPADAAIRAAFHAHQARDKGFGPAAGPHAADALAAAFAGAGYAVRRGESPWRLGPEDGALLCELARGIAGAVRETGAVPEAEVSSWLEARRSGPSCIIGHADLLALPRP